MVFVNSEWLSDLPASEANFLHNGLYDHCPMIIHWENRNMRGKLLFRYFNMCCLDLNFIQKVKNS